MNSRSTMATVWDFFTQKTNKQARQKYETMFKKQTLGNGQIKIVVFQRRWTEKGHTNFGGTEKGYNIFWGDTERSYTDFISREKFWQRKRQVIYSTSCCDISSLKTLRSHCWCKDSKHYEIQSLQLSTHMCKCTHYDLFTNTFINNPLAPIV